MELTDGNSLLTITGGNMQLSQSSSLRFMQPSVLFMSFFLKSKFSFVFHRVVKKAGVNIETKKDTGLLVTDSAYVVLDNGAAMKIAKDKSSDTPAVRFQSKLSSVLFP